MSDVKDALVSMSNEDFRKTYKREKPSENDELIFYCRSGKRSQEALDQALKLGYSKYVCNIILYLQGRCRMVLTIIKIMSIE